MTQEPSSPPGMGWTKITAEYYETLQSQGEAPVDAIVRVADRANRYRDLLVHRGLEVRRLFTLIPGMAVTGPARVLLDLLDEPWVMAIEPDRPVYIAQEE